MIGAVVITEFALVTEIDDFASLGRRHLPGFLVVAIQGREEGGK
jgi:hypothetical protein